MRKQVKKKSRQGADRSRKADRRLVVIEPGDPEVEIVIPRWDGQRSRGNTITAQYSNESDAAYRAFCDYCMMGPTRSFSRLDEAYRQQIDELDRHARGDEMPEGWRRPAEPPTRRLSTLKEWSVSFDWGRRVKGYDEFFVREQLRGYRARIAASLSAQMDLIDDAMTLAGAAIRQELAYYKRTGKIGISFREAIRLFDLSLRNHRKALGVRPDAIEQNIRAVTEVDADTPIDISNEELEQVLATLADALALDQDQGEVDGHDYDQYADD